MSEKKSSYEKKLEYNNAYNREKYRSFSIRFNIQSEDEIIKWLENQPGIKHYLTDLIISDMKKNKEEKLTKKKEEKKDKKKKKKSK